MSISSFKRRFDLLLEKAGLQESNFHGNRYTEYGHIIEPQIRDYVNEKYGKNFVPNRVMDGDIRYHSDGCDVDCVLEVKSTSTIYPEVYSYRQYLSQLVKGMEMNEVVNGVLAVYDRPEDLNPVFDPERLQVFFVDMYMPYMQNLLEKVNQEIDRFRHDLELLKENPLLSEQDFIPDGKSLATIANKVVAFERQLASLKEVEQKCKEMKKTLAEEMAKRGVKSWAGPGGVRITLVPESKGNTKKVKEVDLELLQSKYLPAYSACVREVEKTTSGKSGFVRITIPKG